MNPLYQELNLVKNLSKGYIAYYSLIYINSENVSCLNTMLSNAYNNKTFTSKIICVHNFLNPPICSCREG